MLIRPSFVPRSGHPSHFNERKTTMETEKKLQTKKEWMTPELIVLVRSKPEEAALTGCKIWGMGGPGGAFGCFVQRPTDCDGVCSEGAIT